MQSLFHKIDFIRNDFLVKSMDILCFTESWLSNNLNDELISLDDFELFRNDRVYGRGGGTCIYVRNRLRFDNNISCYCDVDIEIQGINILGTCEPNNCRCIALIVVYRPPRGNSRDACTKID